MRSTACGLISLALLAGCAGKYAPKSAVLTGWDRTRAFSEDKPSTVQYSGHAMVPTPVVPVLPFGSAFDLAVVVGAKKVGVSHYQFGRISAPDGPRWVALEVNEQTGEETLISSLETLDAWAPEIPVKRFVDPQFKVVDRSSEDELDITITYNNADNEAVEAHLLGDPPSRFQKHRNADPLGSMRNEALLLLDVPHRESLFKAKIKVNDHGVTVAKVMGFIPAQLSTEQVAGGLATGSFHTVPSGDARPLDSDWAAPKITAPEPEIDEAVAEPAPEPEPEPDPLRDAMVANVDAFNACYTTAAEANADVEGRVLLSWKIVEGATTEVAAVLDTAGDEALTKCLIDAVTGMTFEGMDGELGFPFTVVKGEGIQLGEQEESEGTTVTGPRGGGDKAEATEGEESEATEGEESEGTTVTAPRGGGDKAEAAEESEGSEGTTVKAPRGGNKAEGEAEDGEQVAEGDDLPEEGGDAEEDLLGDDPDTVSAKRTKEVVYNGLADFTTSHMMGSGNKVELEWKVETTPDRVYVRQVSPERTLQYEYLTNYDSIELSDIAVYQTGRSVPVVHVDINPAIPDLRRPFSGRAESRYVIDINGQGGYATGKVEAWWGEGGPKVKFIPDAPDWTTDGNLVTTIVYRQGSTDIAVRKTGEQ